MTADAVAPQEVAELDSPELETLVGLLAEALHEGPQLWPGLGSFKLQQRSGYDNPNTGETWPDHAMVVFRSSNELQIHLGRALPEYDLEGSSTWLEGADGEAAAQVVDAVAALSEGGHVVVRPLGAFTLQPMGSRAGHRLSFNTAPSLFRALHADDLAADASIVLSASAALKTGRDGLYPEWADGEYATMRPDGTVVPVKR